MYRVTTPYWTFTLPIQTATCKEVMVSIKQGETVLTKHYENGTMPSGMSFDGKQVIVKLTQEETKAFNPRFSVYTQVRVLTNDDDAYASQIFTVKVNDVLNEEILADG